MAWDPEFEAAFSPKAVAFVGASRSQPGGQGAAGGAGNFMRMYQKAGYKGRMYPINPKAEEILGLKCYPNLKSLPERVDLVIISVPAALVPGTLQECAELGLRNIHIFTAGFEETGDPQATELGKRVKEIAISRGLRLVGPNCMGLCWVPRSGLSTWDNLKPTPGNVAMVSQSGAHCSVFCSYGQSIGVAFSKVISFGNGYVLDSTDFLEYLAGDPETEVICMYLEGVRDGHRLLELVRETNPRKPIIMWKGGLTESGARAVRSHTGSLGGQAAIWEGFFRQTGVIRAGSIEELIDVAQCFVRLHGVEGPRVAVLGGGGGNSVAAADACSREGLTTPPVTQETRQALAEFVPMAGHSTRNPLDAGPAVRDPDNFAKALPAVMRDPNIDGFIVSFNVGLGSQTEDEGTQRRLMAHLKAYVEENPTGKPILAVVEETIRLPGLDERRQILREHLVEAKVPVFPSLSRAGRALRRYWDYQCHLKST